MPSAIHAADLGLPGGATHALWGNVPPSPRLAIVGSRACHRALAVAVLPVLRAARDAGWSVVSGGALGIDGHVHRGALEVGVGQLAVLPCGSDRPYPPSHVGLFRRIAATPASGILFAQPRGTRPCRAMFASRNRIVVGLASAVLVVEATARSGSIGTGRMALVSGTPTAAIPGSHGCAALRSEGALRLPWSGETGALRAATRAWLEAVIVGRHLDSTPSLWPASLLWLRQAVEARGSAGLTIDDLDHPLAGLVALTEAETLGLVQEIGPGRYVST